MKIFGPRIEYVATNLPVPELGAAIVQDGEFARVCPRMDKGNA